jgi:Lrp/AsnC family transcriptional regulator for asnA, asnC and gidA
LIIGQYEHIISIKEALMLDSLDMEIMALLEADAHQTSENLAKHLSVSPSTVRRRLNRLLKQNVIRMVAIPMPKEIGFPLTAVVTFKLDHNKVKAFLKQLRDRKEVKCLFITSGRFDALALMWFTSTEDLYYFMENVVGEIDGVITTETFVCLHSEKCF